MAKAAYMMGLLVLVMWNYNAVAVEEAVTDSPVGSNADRQQTPRAQQAGYAADRRRKKKRKRSWVDLFGMGDDEKPGLMACAAIPCLHCTSRNTTHSLVTLHRKGLPKLEHSEALVGVFAIAITGLLIGMNL
jgi:hypothetical protein